MKNYFYLLTLFSPRHYIIFKQPLSNPRLCPQIVNIPEILPAHPQLPYVSCLLKYIIGMKISYSSCISALFLFLFHFYFFSGSFFINYNPIFFPSSSFYPPYSNNAHILTSHDVHCVRNRKRSIFHYHFSEMRWNFHLLVAIFSILFFFILRAFSLYFHIW